VRLISHALGEPMKSFRASVTLAYGDIKASPAQPAARSKNGAHS
jgi:hypothetical protein